MIKLSILFWVYYGKEVDDVEILKKKIRKGIFYVIIIII